MSQDVKDRRALVAAQERVNGIDFIEVADHTQRSLQVHFISLKPDEAALRDAGFEVVIEGSGLVPNVTVTGTNWGSDAAGRPLLTVEVAAPGGFSNYTLRLRQFPGTTDPVSGERPILDPAFDHAEFSFKQSCPSTIDCASPTAWCPPPADTTPPIDYLAKDFRSFRRALLEFSALRYPAWQERSEADFGVMFAEALSSLADDLSYQQDRTAAEAWLETATERRSLVRMARLMDYEPRMATAATVLLAFEVTQETPIPSGVRVDTVAPDGVSVEFETGRKLGDETTFVAAPHWNRMEPYWWDDAERCLMGGAVSMWIRDPGGPKLVRGQQLVIDTEARNPADPPIREVVTLVADGEQERDALCGVDVVRLRWLSDDALRHVHDLTRTTVRGNLVPARHGRQERERFVTMRGWPGPDGLARAIVRTGANRSTQYLYTLRNAPLAWLAQRDPFEGPRPELQVYQIDREPAVLWSWHRRLLDVGREREVVTVEPLSFVTTDPELGTAEYDGDRGETLRFGDGTFGAIPVDGSLYEVTYRVGGGVVGNVAADALTRIDDSHWVAARVRSVSNPLAATGGADAETDAQVRDRVPHAFRARQYRAVRAEDYEKAAATLPWVQRAGTTFRHTGSWLSVFTSVDPKGTTTLAEHSALELTDLLNRNRLAGYESFVLPPRYAALDVTVTVCARPAAFRGDVYRRLGVALDAKAHLDGTRGFFHPDHFTFGESLERSALEAAIQEVAGVAGVIDIRYRRRGHTVGDVVMPDAVVVAHNEVVRVDNNPNRPEDGSVQIVVLGGK